MWIQRTLALVIALAVTAPTLASAETPPAEIPVQGYLSESETEGSAPIDDEMVDMTFIIYDTNGQNDEGTILYESEEKSVTVRNGSFTTHLSPDLSIFRKNTDLWLEMTVEGEIIEPRLRLATVPYAANATYADTAASADGLSEDAAENFQKKLDGSSCDENEHAVGLDADGTVQCDAVESVSAGHGLEKASDGTLSVKYSGALDCPNNKKVTGLKSDGTPICAEDIDTQVGAGTSLSYDVSGDLGLDLSSVTNTCGNGENMYGLQKNGAVQCRTDEVGVESVTAGAGLENNGTPVDPKLDANVSSSEIQDGAVTGRKIQNSSQITASSYDFDQPKTRTVTITGADFHLTTNDEEDIWTAFPSRGRTAAITRDPNADGADVILRSIVQIPSGAAVEKVSCDVLDNSSSNDLDAELYITVPEGTGSTTVTMSTSSRNDPSPTTRDTSSSFRLTPSEGTVGLNIRWAHANSGAGDYDIQLVRCSVRYDISSL